MKLKSILTYFLLAFSYLAIAQYSEDLSSVRPKVDFDEAQFVKDVQKTEPVAIENHANARVELGLEEYVEFLGTIECARGYRIQVYLGKSETEVEEVKKRIKSVEGFEDADIYVEFKVSFRVKVGNYTDRLKAHADLHKLLKEFDKALLLPEHCIPVEKIK